MFSFLGGFPSFLAHADSVQAGLMAKVREGDTSTEGKSRLKLRTKL